MRILLLSDWMSNRGGAEAYIVSLRDCLRDGGDDVRLLTCGSGAREIDTVDHAFGTDALLPQTFLQLHNPFVVSRAKSIVREFRPDVALLSQFAYHMSPSVIHALAPVPVVVSMMDYKSICPLGTRLLPDGTVCMSQPGNVCRKTKCLGTLHWIRDQARYALMGKAMRSVDRVICSSPWAQSQLAASGIAADSIPLGTAVPVGFQRRPAMSPVFAYCGRLSREKGVAVLIAALARVRAVVPDVRLRILGDGPLRRDLERLAGALGVIDVVEFQGWLDSGDLDEQLHDVWAVVAPSLWAEPFGLAAIESIVRGIPVIASNSGGFLETVQNGFNGLTFKAGDVAELAQRMESIARGRDFPGAVLKSDVVAKTADKYSIAIHTGAVRDILSQVASTPAANSA
jgi:glycosyltransferase involved in cell wall biosynthesis